MAWKMSTQEVYFAVTGQDIRGATDALEKHFGVPWPGPYDALEILKALDEEGVAYTIDGTPTKVVQDYLDGRKE